VSGVLLPASHVGTLHITDKGITCALKLRSHHPNLIDAGYAHQQTPIQKPSRPHQNWYREDFDALLELLGKGKLHPVVAERAVGRTTRSPAIRAYGDGKTGTRVLIIVAR
jgi:hypothetical protein